MSTHEVFYLHNGLLLDTSKNESLSPQQMGEARDPVFSKISQTWKDKCCVFNHAQKLKCGPGYGKSGLDVGRESGWRDLMEVGVT